MQMKYIIQRVLTYMNKTDAKLIFVILLISLFLFIFLNKENGNYAYVYYDGKEILKIDLSKDDYYTVKGYNGDVVMEVRNSKLRVKEETSTYHICSKKGYTNSGNIVCLPNKIVIEFKNDVYDTMTG